VEAARREGDAGDRASEGAAAERGSDAEDSRGAVAAGRRDADAGGADERARALLLAVRGLCVDRPDGSPLLADVTLELRAREVVAVFGASGAGKSTLTTALHEPDSLRARGFAVRTAEVVRAGAVGIVPQRGALFDHLSAADNIALALRNAEPPAPATGDAVREWFKKVDLPAAWSAPGHAVAHVSGGEAQRLAVARTLAGGRRVLLLDEPSVGLDPHRVALLAATLRGQIDGGEAAALVVTHDLGFAAAFADRFLYMDPQARGLVELAVTPGRGEATERALAAAVRERLASERRTDAGAARPGLAARLRGLAAEWAAPFAAGARVLAALPAALRRPRDLVEVLRVTLMQALVRPGPFFVIVSLLIGATLLYIFHRALGGGGLPVRPDRVFSLIGSMHVLALAPPLSAILFAATSGSAITAWLGGMSLTRQTAALRGLGIAEARYLWLPAWLGLALAYVMLAAVFTAGMIAGGVAYLQLRVPQAGDAWALVTADLLDPTAERAVFRTRAAVLVLIYAVGVASDAVAKGGRDKPSAESVTAAMVRSVMACTLWVVAVELVSLMVVYGARG
jgi:ABC-type nitrate/sulfonate/bicarbonate transport system ATPase subunit/ABC-type transporter Mla maintaining outer membrane lipid asymmetry permease subunit MlaE